MTFLHLHFHFLFLHLIFLSIFFSVKFVPTLKFVEPYELFLKLLFLELLPTAKVSVV